MTLSWRFVTFWLPWLSVISTCAWAILSGVKESTRDRSRSDCDPLDEGTTNAPVAMPAVRQRGERTIWIASMLMMLALGLALGYGVRDRELIANTRMYFGVTVMSQQSDRRYMVQIPGYIKSYDWEFCHPLKMPGPLIDIKYEQRFGCKAVNGVGFIQIHEEKKNELQTGRDSSTAKPAAYAMEAGR